MNKELELIALFYNEPSKHWHFTEIKKHVPIADSKLSKWLKRFQEEHLIKRTKHPGKMPYYQGNHTHAHFRQKKRLYGLNMLYKSGLLTELGRLNAKAVIIFGSFSRSDWYKESDIDIFIYGKKPKLARYEQTLQREIQIFTAKNRKELEKFQGGLMKNILQGIVIQGYLPDELYEATRETTTD